jgi:hypothetical protein
MKRIAWGLACASMLQASSAMAELGWVLEADLEFGGDTVATVFFTDGSSQDTEAGQGLAVAVGAHYRFPDSNWDARATLGYKYVTTQASDVDIYLRRVPMEFIVNYMFDGGTWLGLGLSRHTGTRYHGGGVIPDIEFEDATGTVFEFGYHWLGLSLTRMDYTAVGGGTVSADNFGIKLIGRF